LEIELCPDREANHLDCDTGPLYKCLIQNSPQNLSANMRISSLAIFATLLVGNHAFAPASRLVSSKDTILLWLWQILVPMRTHPL
jgi:hypothetical protein